MYQPTNVATQEHIAATCAKIQDFIEAHYNADVPAAVVDRATEIEGYMALSGKLLADAKYHHSSMMHSIFIDAVKQGNKDKMQTSTLNKYIESICRDSEYLVNWCDRINRACTHQLEFSRTILSKLKVEVNALRYGGS